jgi:hypothetical protein
MKTIKVGRTKYKISLDNIVIGDTAYNPLSNVIVKITEEEDDLVYVNEVYFKVVGKVGTDNKLEIEREKLRRQFKNDNGVNWENSQGEPDIDYVRWLEEYIFNILPE